MKRETVITKWGVSIVEDTDTGELSLQCYCGDLGQYTQRIVLTADEVAEYRAGTLDTASLAYEICKETDRMTPRIVASFPEAELVLVGKPGSSAAPKTK